MGIVHPVQRGFLGQGVQRGQGFVHHAPIFDPPDSQPRPTVGEMLICRRSLEGTRHPTSSMNRSVNVVMMTALLLAFGAVAVISEDVQPSFVDSDKTETTLNINEQISRSNGRTRRAYRQAVLRRDRRVARFVARLRWNAFRQWSAHLTQSLFGFADEDYMIRDSAESVNGKRYAMFTVNGIRRKFRIKSFGGRLYYRLCEGLSCQTSKELIASRKNRFKDRGVNLSIRVTDNDTLWMSHMETGVYGRGPVRSVEDLYEEGYEIRDSSEWLRQQDRLNPGSTHHEVYAHLKASLNASIDGRRNSGFTTAPPMYAMIEWYSKKYSEVVGDAHYGIEEDGMSEEELVAELMIESISQLAFNNGRVHCIRDSDYDDYGPSLSFHARSALARLESACQAAHKMKRCGEISDAEYDQINKMIWACENIVKGIRDSADYELSGGVEMTARDCLVMALRHLNLVKDNLEIAGDLLPKEIWEECNLGASYEVEQLRLRTLIAIQDIDGNDDHQIRDSKICYVEKRFQSKSMDIIDQANEIIAEYQEEGMSLTLRQLYYQFVARDLIENTMRSYKRMGSIINDGRLAGLIDWNSIEDRTRSLYGVNCQTGPWSAIRRAVWSYHEDRWANQSVIIEAWIEKEALSGVISRICSQYQVDYFACKGYVSQSELHGAAMRHRRYEEEGKNVIVLHLGDHDPSGMDMTRDIEDRLSLFGASTEVRRIALSMAQIEQYSPPPNPAKTTDSRSTGYIEEFGDSSWELDALEPRVLRDLIEAHVLAERDEDQWEIDEAAEQASKDQLEAISDNYHEVIQFLEDEDYLIRDSDYFDKGLGMTVICCSHPDCNVAVGATHEASGVGNIPHTYCLDCVVIRDSTTVKWIVMNKDGTTTLCDSQRDMEARRGLSSTASIEGPYAMSEAQIRHEEEMSAFYASIRDSEMSEGYPEMTHEEVDSAYGAALMALEFARHEIASLKAESPVVTKIHYDFDGDPTIYLRWPDGREDAVVSESHTITASEQIQHGHGGFTLSIRDSEDWVGNVYDCDHCGAEEILYVESVYPKLTLVCKGCLDCDCEIRDSDYSFQTESGHQVDWNDGSICVTFAEGTVYKHDKTEWHGITREDGYISGDWYGGDNESPDHIDFGSITINKDGKWVDDTSDDAFEEVSVEVDDLEYDPMGFSFDKGLPADFKSALEEAVGWFLADFEEKTVVTRSYIRDSAEKAFNVAIYEIRCPRCNQFIAYNNGSPAVMWLISDHADECIRDSDFIMTDEACQCLTNIDLLRESVRKMAEIGELPPRSDALIQKHLSECEAHIRRYKWESVEDKVNNNHLLIRDSADSASLESLQARAEALARWCGPEAVQKGERDLETVDFMPYMIKSHELIHELLGLVENAVDSDPFGRLPNWNKAEDGTKVWPDTIRDSAVCEHCGCTGLHSIQEQDANCCAECWHEHRGYYLCTCDFCVAHRDATADEIRDSTEYFVEVHIVKAVTVTVCADSLEDAERKALEVPVSILQEAEGEWESHSRKTVVSVTPVYENSPTDMLRDSAIESERGEKGAASLHLSLSQGRITVTHGTKTDWVLHEGIAEDGTWDAIWEVIRSKVWPDTDGVFQPYIRDSAECVPNAHPVMWEGKEDDNDGLIYGIEYMNGEEVSDCEWFKTEAERDASLKRYLGEADSCHWAVRKYVDTCEFPPSEEQMKILNDWAYGLEYWLEDDGWPAPKIGVFASAGSGKTKGIMEPALIIAGHIESSLDTRATAFNVHIAAELKALIQRVRADYGFSGAKTIGQGNNTVNGAGYALLRDHYAKNGIAVEYDGLSRDKPFPIGDRKDMVIPRVVLVENMTIAGDGGKAIYRLASESKVLTKDNFRGYFRRIVNDLATLATVLKNQGFNPLHREYDSGEEMMEAIEHTIKPQISRQGLHENVILTMGKVGMRMLLETMLYHAQLPRDSTLKEFCPFSHRQYIDLLGFPHPMGEWVIPAPSQNCGNGQGKYDTDQTTVREMSKVVNATLTTVAVDIGLFYPPRSKYAKTKKVTVTDNKPSCALYPIEGMINEFEKYNGMLRVEFSQTGGNQAYARSIDGMKVADYLWKCVPGHINGKRFGGKNSDWINPLMNALGIKQTNDSSTHWLRIMPNDPAVVEKLRKAYDGKGKTFLGPDEAKEEYSSTSSRGTLVLAMSDMTWLPNVYDLQAYKKWDICMIDEVQDLSPNQANLLWRCCDLDDDATAVLMVGDSKQAIYLFAGSGPTAMTENANRIGAKLYPMTVTWRQSVKAAESCRSMCEGASKIVKNTWKNIELPDYNDHNSPAIKEWRQGAGNVTIDISQIPDAIEHLSQSPTISLTEADKTFAVISRTNGPLASVMKNLISRGIPVSTPSGQGGIVSEICNLLKKEYKDKLYAKNHKQGFGMLYVDSKGKKYNQYTNPSNGSKDALIRSLSKRCEQVLDMEWEQAVRRANGDQSLASRDEGFIEIDSIIDLVETLLLMWVENQYDKDGFSISVDAFRSWCKNDLFSAEGDGCHVTSVHRYKGAQNSVSFILRGYPTQDKDGKPTVTDPFLRPFLIENSPESAIEEANILYVAGSRSKDQNIIVSVLDEDDDGGLPPVAGILDDAWGVDPEVVDMIRDSATIESVHNAISNLKEPVKYRITNQITGESMDVELDAEWNVGERKAYLHIENLNTGEEGEASVIHGISGTEKYGYTKSVVWKVKLEIRDSAERVCECCGTTQGISLSGGIPYVQDICGPTTDCAENKAIRDMLEQHVHPDYDAVVCEALGITSVVRDSNWEDYEDDPKYAWWFEMTEEEKSAYEDEWAAQGWAWRQEMDRLCPTVIRDSALPAKSTKTLEMIDTVHEDWGYPDYIVKEELRNVKVPCVCPDCHGKKAVYHALTPIDESGEFTPRWEGDTQGYRDQYFRIAPRLTTAESLLAEYVGIDLTITKPHPYNQRNIIAYMRKGSKAFNEWADEGDLQCGRFTEDMTEDEVKLWLEGDEGLSEEQAAKNKATGYHGVRYTVAREIVEPGWVAMGYKKYETEYMGRKSDTGRCRTCTSRRAASRGHNRGRHGVKGYVERRREMLCDVHYPAWPENTTFDSRFHRHDCELCGKNGIKSSTYPILAKRADGTHEGMFVGNACIQKMGWKKFKSLTDLWVKKSGYSGIELSPSKPQLYPRTYETHDVDLEESPDTWMLPELTPQEANLLLVMYRNGEADLTNSGAVSKREISQCGQEEALESLVKRGLVEIDHGWGVDEPRHHWLLMGRNLNSKMFDRLMWRYEQENAFIMLMGCIEDHRGPVDAGEITESAKAFLKSVGRMNSFTDEIIRDSAEDLLEDLIPSFTVCTEDMDGQEITFMERVLMEDGNFLLVPVTDVIQTMTHPLNGRTVTAPTNILAKIFVRWDVGIGHEQAMAHMKAEMGKIDPDTEDDSIRDSAEIVIQMTDDNMITKVFAVVPPLGIPEEIEYRIEYVRDSAQYVDITRDEFEDFIVDAQGFVCIDPSEYKEKRIGQFCRECVYEYPLTEEGRQIGSIRIYSSIPANNPFVMKQGQSKSREKGKDAIRCLIVNEQGWPTKKFPHTKRVKNWRLNLMRKYEPFMERGMRCIYCDEKSEETYCSDYCYNMSEYGNEEGVLSEGHVQ